MGNTAGVASTAAPAKFDDASAQLQMRIPRDVLFIVLGNVADLKTFFSCLRTCRVVYNFLNQEERWLTQLALVCDEQFPGRRLWVGYQTFPAFLGVAWEDYHGQLEIPALQEHANVRRRDVFRSKRLITERFDLFSGWGSLLHRNFIEGFFHNGSLVLGTLYDMSAAEGPRIVYSGFLSRGMRHGAMGQMYYPDGAVAYRGEFVDDEMHGQGTSFWKNGSEQYRGQFRFGVKDGIGTQEWATGSYEGEWKFNVPHGRGCWRWKDATKFVGCMDDGKRSGFGLLFYPEVPGQPAVVEYEGQWRDDLLDGLNKHYDHSGVLKFDGNFVRGLKQEEGRSYKNVDGRSVLSYDGEYYAGKKEGRGTKFDSTTGEIIYRGQWKKSVYHGKGSVKGGPVKDYRNGHIKTHMVEIEEEI